MIKINVYGDKELVAKLGVTRYQSIVKKSIIAAATEFKGEIAEYPKQSLHRGMEFSTDRQRRGFFAKLRSGEIDVPYRRGISPGSERHGQSWTVKARSWHTAVVGSDTRYGPFLQDETLQSQFHYDTGWETAEDATVRTAKQISEAFAHAMREFTE